ncbi:MAG: inositol monophosphatase [Desulfobacteraceae bacterium]|nr:inositol monophosphatase [Desulfobacteraceae bacterium]
MELEYIKRVGISAAYKGGEVIRSYLGRISKISKKGAIDLVTEADIASEKAVIETIRSQFPHHAVLSEESGMNEGETDYQWIIDPLDGTTNFAHELGIFSVSIAFALEGNIVTGIVFNPESKELFTATAGKGAELNGKPINVSNTEAVSESLLVTGFPYNFKEIFDPLIARFSNCLRASQAVRRLGSAALDLCFVACGRFDGFWEQNLNPWDTAAGMLIAKEAGAKVTDFSDRPFSIAKKEILATNSKIHSEMISLLELKDKI